MPEPTPQLSARDQAALSAQLFDLHEYVYGEPLDCFCGSDRDLIEAVDDLRGRAAELGDDR